MPTPMPPFIPREDRTGDFIAFILNPGSGYGADHAMLHGDDFDEVLAAVPMDALAWQILAVETGRIVAGSNPAHDRSHAPLPGEGDAIVFLPSETEWGAWCAVRRTPLDDVAAVLREIEEAGLGDPDDPRCQVLDLTRSVLYDPQDGEERVIPGFAQLADYEVDLAEWRLENMAEDNDEPEETAGDAETRAWADSSVLPEGWEDLSNDDLRALVEDAERKLGKSPEEIQSEIDRATHLLEAKLARLTE